MTLFLIALIIALLGAGCLRREPPPTSLPPSPPSQAGDTAGVAQPSTEFPDDLNDALKDLELLDDIE